MMGSIPVLIENSTMRTIKRKHFHTLTSTQDEAKKHAYRLQKGAWLLITADQQTAGQGTHGRAWCSPLGNLYATFSTRIDAKKRRFVPNVAQTAALSIIHAIHALDLSLHPTLKWVNDVMLNGKKVAGVLCETHPFPHTHKDIPPTFVLHIGIGINIYTNPQTLTHIDQPTTTLMLEQDRTMLDKEKLLNSLKTILCQHIHTLFSQGPEALKSQIIGVLIADSNPQYPTDASSESG